MNSFTFTNPTRIIFGRDVEKNVGAEIAPHARKVLFHYGGQSIKKYGLYDVIVESLNDAGVEFVELGGVKPNPRLSLVQEGIALCRKENIGFILAVGGGSVIDSSKAIALGVPYSGDVWDFFDGTANPAECLPLATVLTIPAAGSEASNSAVITYEEKTLKRSVGTDLIYPKFSFLDPKLCMTLPKDQIVNGVSDMMSHIMERYFSNTPHVDLTDSLCEAALRTIIGNAYKLKADDQDYDAWAEIMLSGYTAHNNTLGMGRTEDWACHGIEHELSAEYDIAHGAGLSIITPAWMKHVYAHNIPLFAQFAQNVFNVQGSLRDLESIARQGIESLEHFYQHMELPIRLSQIGLDGSAIEVMAKRASREGGLGHFKKLSTEDITAIYKLAL